MEEVLLSLLSSSNGGTTRRKRYVGGSGLNHTLQCVHTHGHAHTVHIHTYCTYSLYDLFIYFFVYLQPCIRCLQLLIVNKNKKKKAVRRRQWVKPCLPGCAHVHTHTHTLRTDSTYSYILYHSLYYSNYLFLLLPVCILCL